MLQNLCLCRSVCCVISINCDWHCFVISSGILSVLQTPPVVRKTASLLGDGGATSSVSKSILSAARHKISAVSGTAARLTWDSMFVSLVSAFCCLSFTLFTHSMHHCATSYEHYAYVVRAV